MSAFENSGNLRVPPPSKATNICTPLSFRSAGVQPETREQIYCAAVQNSTFASRPILCDARRTANTIGSNMFEEFEPSANRIIRDYIMDKITFCNLLKWQKT